MIHIYYGDGKGKTTAAIGLLIRSIGAGNKAIFAQFVKDNKSSEIEIIKELDGVMSFLPEKVYGFTWEMTKEEKEEAHNDYRAILKAIIEEVKKSRQAIVVLDELAIAAKYEIVKESEIREFIKELEDITEIVITGAKVPTFLMMMGDYITKMEKIKHPYDKGILARKGIEF